MPMPLGLWASDAIVAVSPTYAREILGEQFGSGLQEFLQTRKDSISGILNGLDISSFDPQTDSTLAVNFTADSLSLRPRNKAALQERVGLPILPDVPLMGMVTRMDVQKGVDIALKGLKLLGRQNWQLVLLGAGDPKLETMAKNLQAEMPDRIRVETRYDAKLARQIYGGADIFLMPSRYEPCGTSQMISMRYGCLPLVSAVGGLLDTVSDGVTGFTFSESKVKPFNDAIRRALAIYPERERWEEMQKAGMALDFSWPRSARKYLELYKKLLETSSNKITVS
jgi:starch synthase